VIFVFDIDETVCWYEDERDYEKALPHIDRISRVNRLYDEGNTVIYWTARGSVTGKDWFKLTKNQLKKWGAKYHDLRMKKPHYDLFVCDKAVNSEDFFRSEA